MPRPRRRVETPSMTATVARELVHRAAVAETLLTDWKRTDPDRFQVSAQWPRAHELHVSCDRTAYDPLLVVETVRQSGTLIAHTEYDVPLGHQFVLDELRVETSARHLAVGVLPAEPILDIAFTDVRHRGTRMAAARYTAEVRCAGEQVAYADVGFTCLSTAVYERLRAGRTSDPASARPPRAGLPPEGVARVRPADVVLSPTDGPDRWELRVDTAHPVFFDHPLDHVPGMLLLEAARQAVLWWSDRKREPVSYHARFHRYAELDSPVWIALTCQDDATLQVVGEQGESTIFECLVGTTER
ncbi:ScbA/BarX family gamma-butyrolactone biosynthesis protein [Streptomyces adustus]